jgi:hypothetical protein
MLNCRERRNIELTTANWKPHEISIAHHSIDDKWEINGVRVREIKGSEIKGAVSWSGPLK